MRLFGRRPVLERLRKAPQTVSAVYLEQGVEAAEVVHAVKQAGLHFTSLSKPAFRKMAGEVHAQGVLAETKEFEYAALADILKEKEKILFFLDRVTDPQNVGNLLRTLACLGGIALVLPKHDSAPVNGTVLRVACGGENYVPVARVTNLVQAAELSKKAGYWIVGTSTSEGEPVDKVSWPWPLGVVFGSEGGGIRPGLAKHLDLFVTLPMKAPLSYNVATAAALVGFEILRSRKSLGM